MKTLFRTFASLRLCGRHLLTLCVLCMFLSGCAGLILQGVDNKATLSTEQIDAYNRVGSSVYGCFKLGGPPPAGNTTWIVVPKTAAPNFAFMPDCSITSVQGGTVASAPADGALQSRIDTLETAVKYMLQKMIETKDAEPKKGTSF